jgi:hypothetical protein
MRGRIDALALEKLALCLPLGIEVFPRQEEAVTIIKAIEANSDPGGVSGAIRRAEDALAGVLSKHSPVLYRIAVRKVGNAENAQGTRKGFLHWGILRVTKTLRKSMLT